MTGATEPGAEKGPVVVLCGGIGGAKLVLGLDRLAGERPLHVVVNTGDDFEHLGLHVSPDLDTVLYTLAGIANPETGWGRADETWSFMAALEALGGETWFRLGDRDLALHVERTRRLRAGESLSEITQDVAGRLGVRSRLAPMSDDRVATVVDTDEGRMPFQRYFVEAGARPCLRAIGFEGAPAAVPAPGVLEALAAPDLRGVVIAPSNPWLSIDPLLAIPALREALAGVAAPVIAVSPIVGGKAVKGPTAKIMRELGVPVSPHGIARHYAGLIDGIVIDRQDAGMAESIDIAVETEDTIMNSLDDRMALGRACLAFLDRLRDMRSRRGAA